MIIWKLPFYISIIFTSKELVLGDFYNSSLTSLFNGLSFICLPRPPLYLRTTHQECCNQISPVLMNNSITSRPQVQHPLKKGKFMPHETITSLNLHKSNICTRVHSALTQSAEYLLFGSYYNVIG